MLWSRPRTTLCVLHALSKLALIISERKRFTHTLPDGMYRQRGPPHTVHLSRSLREEMCWHACVRNTGIARGRDQEEPTDETGPPMQYHRPVQCQPVCVPRVCAILGLRTPNKTLQLSHAKVVNFLSVGVRRKLATQPFTSSQRLTFFSPCSRSLCPQGR